MTDQEHTQRLLEGKVAIVTGASRGIGKMICTELASEGADIVAVGFRDTAGAEDTAREVRALGRRALSLTADLRDEDQVEGMLTAARDALGHVDILVNNAGGGGVGKPLHTISGEEWDQAFLINTRSTFLCSAAAARTMINRGKGGTIINIAGASAHRNYPGYGGFGASKAAVNNLTEQASVEWAPFGIRVNGVSPGPIRDPDTDWRAHEPVLAAEVEQLPMRRAGTRWEVARTVVFLASAQGGFITGQTIIVDGGGVNTWYLTGTTRSGEKRAFWGK